MKIQYAGTGRMNDTVLSVLNFSSDSNSFFVMIALGDGIEAQKHKTILSAVRCDSKPKIAPQARKNRVFRCFFRVFLVLGIFPCRNPPGVGGWVSDLKIISIFPRYLKIISPMSH